MESPNLDELEIYKLKFNKIVENYKNLNDNLKNIYNDIKKLENVHNTYINNDEMSSLNYSTYVDDIRHQINITNIEYIYLSDVLNLNLNKFYRDLFKLYSKIIRTTLDIFKENKDIVIKIWNSSDKISNETHEFKKIKKSIRLIADATRINSFITHDNKIFEEIKKKWFTNIKIYNELEKDIFDISNIITIYNELHKRLEELLLSKELIKYNLDDIKFKADKGILTQTFVMDLNGKIDRIKIDYKIVVQILESILNIHLTISDRANNIGGLLANYINYDEDSIDNDVKKPSFFRSFSKKTLDTEISD